MTTQSGIATHHLTKNVTLPESREPLTILKDISFDIPAASSFAIVGESGSGKTTLLSLLAALDEPSSGDISINGESFGKADETTRTQIRAKYIGFVFQNFQLIDHLSALDNVRMPIEIKQKQGGIDRGINANELAKSYLHRVKLDHRFKHSPNQLSGGEQQRVAIARAFACQAPFLFADEPTGNLDKNTSALVEDLLFDLQQEQKTTLILVTHDPRLAQKCQHSVELEGGRLLT